MKSRTEGHQDIHPAVLCLRKTPFALQQERTSWVTKPIKRIDTSARIIILKSWTELITAEEDADVDIVMTAINKINTRSNVMVVGSYTDLSVLLIALSPGQKNIYFCKEKNGVIHSTVLHKIETMIEKYKNNKLLGSS
ncbi:hypothetical protein AVEN_161315-1 [Araneus ventricosus]|uniref:Uncharacterized protein n=1 Tax=Araneus ventricosus TaxID=182803 RepID=A0A4Y2X076_ARAVE|nr:hypothetical protein AVEN_161315-1 [Araneus ventricosus]